MWSILFGKIGESDYLPYVTLVAQISRSISLKFMMFRSLLIVCGQNLQNRFHKHHDDLLFRMLMGTLTLLIQFNNLEATRYNNNYAVSHLCRWEIAAKKKNCHTNSDSRTKFQKLFWPVPPVPQISVIIFSHIFWVAVTK